MRRSLPVLAALAAALALATTGCSSDPSGGGNGGSVEWRMDTNRLAAQPGKIVTHTATCPSGTVAVSGGYNIEKNAAPMEVVSTLPMGDKWRVSVRNGATEPQTLEIVVYVGCAGR